MVWEIGINFRFRYAKVRDVGISVYLIIVVIFFYNQITTGDNQTSLLRRPSGCPSWKILDRARLHKSSLDWGEDCGGHQRCVLVDHGNPGVRELGGEARAGTG